MAALKYPCSFRYGGGSHRMFIGKRVMFVMEKFLKMHKKVNIDREGGVSF
jgi:hypothetical protein